MSLILPPKSHIWLQPVRINPEQYRLFVEALNSDLADLEAQFADRRHCGDTRQGDVQIDRNSLNVNLDDTTPQGPASH